MEEKIKQIGVRLKGLFMLFWIIPIIGVIVGEYGDEWVGAYADNVRVRFFSETFVILLTAVCVPLSLKLFSLVLKKKIDKASLPDALYLYWFWSCVRMLLLFLPVLAGFCVYYMVLSNTGALCALVAMTASLFCLPSEERIREELHISKEENE